MISIEIPSPLSSLTPPHPSDRGNSGVPVPPVAPLDEDRHLLSQSGGSGVRWSYSGPSYR